MASDNTTDIFYDLQQIERTIQRKKVSGKIDEKHTCEWVMNIAIKMMRFSSDFYAANKVYMHHAKAEVIPRQILPALKKLMESCSFYIKNNQYDQNKLLEDLQMVKHAYMDFAATGSVYMARHCDKLKGRVSPKTGLEYEGIPPAAVWNQAKAVADEIANEVLMSPKKVKVIFLHSELPRTRIFADVIFKTVAQARYKSTHSVDDKGYPVGDKVHLEDPKYDDRIRFGFWTKEALDEVMPTYRAIGDSATYLKWQRGELPAEFKHQPNPEDVYNSVHGFFKQYSKVVDANDGYYTIVVALTHSWLIDAFLYPLFTREYESRPEIIETATFCKYEMGQIFFRNKWVDFK